MKVHIWCGERYPDYGVSISPSFNSKTVDITEEFYAEIVATESAYNAVQDKLEELSKQQRPAPPAPPERITQAEIDAIKDSTPVEDEQSIQAAVDAVNERMAKVA